LGKKQDVDEFKLYASVHGVKFDDEKPESGMKKYKYGMLPSEEEVAHLSLEERRKLTKDLMKQFSASFGNAPGMKIEQA